MTEFSRYWDSTVTGDAGAYTSDIYTNTWKKLFTRLDDEGVLDDYLNELEPSGITGGVSVKSGAAIVNGSIYENTSDVSTSIPTPVANPRIDRLVIRKDWGLQTIRITRIEGTEAGAPVAPTITQTEGSLWDIPIAQILITTAGAITVTDERDIANSPLVATVGLSLIEELVSDGSFTQFNFENIPQTFRHLKIIGHGKISSTPVASGFYGISIRFNGDAISGNYALQSISGIAAVPGSSALNAIEPAVFSFPDGGASDEYAGQGTILIPNYTQSIYKLCLQKFAQFNDLGVSDSLIITEGGLWESVDVIETITLVSLPIATVFAENTIMSLYGIN